MYKCCIALPTLPARGEPPEPDKGWPVGEEVEGVPEEHGLDVGDDLHLAHVVVDLGLRADHPGVADGLSGEKSMNELTFGIVMKHISATFP